MLKVKPSDSQDKQRSEAMRPVTANAVLYRMTWCSSLSGPGTWRYREARLLQQSRDETEPGNVSFSDRWGREMVVYRGEGDFQMIESTPKSSSCRLDSRLRMGKNLPLNRLQRLRRTIGPPAFPSLHRALVSGLALWRVT